MFYTLAAANLKYSKRKMTLLTMATTKIKWYLYNEENYKNTEEYKKRYNRWRAILYSWLLKFITTKMSIPINQSTNVMPFSSKS